MDSRQVQRDQLRHQRRRPSHTWLGRVVASAALVGVIVGTLVIVLSSMGGTASRKHPSRSARVVLPTSKSAAAQIAAVPILAYNIINVAPPGSAAPPSLYVPAGQFSAQMQALKAAGWHAVTLDQLHAYWTHGVSLGTGKPIVITFDSGYASQYTNALPVLKSLGWVGVENLQVNGLSPSEGGMSDAQVRGLISAGWELDTDGLDGINLTSVGSGQLSSEVASARQTLSTRYGVAVNWFSYPSGGYNPAVVSAVQSAGYLGALTSSAGWASPQADRFLLPRLEVLAQTSASTLLTQIASAQSTTSAPASAPGTSA